MALPQPLHKEIEPAPAPVETLSAAELMEQVMIKGEGRIS